MVGIEGNIIEVIEETLRTDHMTAVEIRMEKME